MARTALAMTFLLLGTACTPQVAAESASPPASLEDVKAAVEGWLEGVTGPEQAFRATLPPEDGSALTGRAINERLFVLHGGTSLIGIGFSQPPRADSSLAELRSTFKHLALDRIPVPGIRARGWQTRLLTPRSSFREGVTLQSWQDGVLSIRVQTTFFAVSARRTDILVPADAPMPPGTFFQIRRPIRADLLIEGDLPLEKQPQGLTDLGDGGRPGLESTSP